MWWVLKVFGNVRTYIHTNKHMKTLIHNVLPQNMMSVRLVVVGRYSLHVSEGNVMQY